MTAVELIAAHPWIVKCLHNIDPMKLLSGNRLHNHYYYNDKSIHLSYHWYDKDLFVYRYITIYSKFEIDLDIYAYDSRFRELPLFHDLFKLCNNFNESLINFI